MAADYAISVGCPVSPSEELVDCLKNRSVEQLLQPEETDMLMKVSGWGGGGRDRGFSKIMLNFSIIFFKKLKLFLLKLTFISSIYSTFHTVIQKRYLSTGEGCKNDFFLHKNETPFLQF